MTKPIKTHKRLASIVLNADEKILVAIFENPDVVVVGTPDALSITSNPTEGGIPRKYIRKLWNRAFGPK